MTDNIKLRVDALLKEIQDMKNDGMEFVDLYIMDKENLDGDLIPKTLSLSAYTSKFPEMQTEYEMLEEVE